MLYEPGELLAPLRSLMHVSDRSGLAVILALPWPARQGQGQGQGQGQLCCSVKQYYCTKKSDESSALRIETRLLNDMLLVILRHDHAVGIYAASSLL